MKARTENQTVYRHIVETNSNLQRYLNIAPSLKEPTKKDPTAEFSQPKILLKPKS